MKDFDKRIKEMAKDEKWDMPESIDREIDSVLGGLDNMKIKKKKPLKVALIVLAVAASTVTSAFAIEKVMDYFQYNKDSAFVSSKGELESLGENINLSAKDKGIEFTVDNIAMDEGFVNVFYTIKSDKKIKDINKEYENVFNATPLISIAINGKEVLGSSDSIIKSEAIYSSDTELKGMSRISIAKEELSKDFDMKIYANTIFGQEGNWSVSTKVDKSKGVKESRKYNVNKEAVVKGNLGSESGEEVDIKVKIDKVTISPFGSQIVIKEKGKGIIGTNFALFDQNGKSLDVLDEGLSAGMDGEEIVADNAYEFLKATKDTKSISYVPFMTDSSIESNMIEPKSIGKMPIEFQISKHGKVIVEDVKITDKETRITFYKDGVVPSSTEFFFFDGKGKGIDGVGGFLQYSINRHTGRYTAIISYEKGNKNASKIKKISTYESHINLLKDQEIKIDLIDKK